MPSLFSRSKTTPTPNKQSLTLPHQPLPALDEFGRVSSKLSTLSVNSFTPASKKDKKKAKEQEKRLKAQGSARDRPDLLQPADPHPLPDGTFLSLNLDRPRTHSGTDDHPKQLDYGYLSYERHVVLGLEQVARLVIVISDELATRGGITTPFIFSTTALDISSGAIRRLIRAFLNTCTDNHAHVAAEAESMWRDEARFAGPHELGMCLRWGIARVVRSLGGHDVRGLISWDHYIHFRDSEAALKYPPTHFSTFLTDLAPTIQSILISLLTLLSRLTANSTCSGHTPPTLSPLFGPLIFGLGPATLPFHHTYIHYLRAVNAMEHILLAFIRWQDAPQHPHNGPGATPISGSAAALGVPIRLKEWIKGYPAMLPFLQDRNKNQKPQPRRGVRTVRVMSVRRNVRMYSPDLVRTAASWATRSRSASSGPGENGLVMSKEWSRIAPPSLKLHPRYSEGFKKRMNLPAGFHPDLGPGSYQAPLLAHAASASSYTSSTSVGTSIVDEREGEDRFRSLTDLKWGEFESVGFGGLGETPLQFDLTESARTTRSTKRETLSWNDFSSAGFSRGDGPLSATLQFSSPVAKAISTWPAHNAEMSKKLKKTEKSLPPFGWDTEPVIGNEEVIEEAFVDVFCDLVYGGGWMDLERVEELDRDCNWALIEFKSLSQHQTTTNGTSDPRTSTTLVLFEEFVPLEYREQLAVTSSSRRRLPSLFSQSKTKTWKQAPTLNGRPYIVGHVPRSPSYRELEFEGLLNGANATKVITLEPKNPPRASTMGPPPLPRPSTPVSIKSPTISSPLYMPPGNPGDTSLLEVPTLHSGSRSDENHTDSTRSSLPISQKRVSRFRLPVPMSSPGGRRTGLVPSEYSTVDFETRLASYSDDEYNNGGDGEMPESEAVKQKRRQSKDDAWVDILVGAHARRMAGQDAQLKEGVGGGAERRRGVRSRRSDPDIASLEVAQVLAGVRERTLSSPSSSVHHLHQQHQRVDMDMAGGLERFYNDNDVDEIETVPRTSEARSEDDTTDQSHSRDMHHHGGDADDEDDYEPPSVAARLLASAKSQRRMGYFDLHPERRAAVADLPRTSEEDPRDRLAYDEDSDDERAIAPPPVTPPRYAIPPEPKLPPPQVPAPSHHSTIALKVQVEPNADVSPIGTPETGKNIPQSKTAALIEMYRERERTTPTKSPTSGPGQISIPPLAPIAPLQPSRLPVRSASKEPIVPPALVVEVVTEPGTPPEVEPGMDAPPRMNFEETGRASPARYVHGAPLQNVIEEEEEE